MLAFLPGFILLLLTSTLAAINTAVMVPLLLIVALLKLLLPVKPLRRLCSSVILRIAETWIDFNSGLIRLVTRADWQVSGVEHLQHDGWYLVLSNHQSWVDILVLQRICNHRIPFLKFFLKRQLIWVPFLGLAWWALDFPFMQRYTKEQLKRHPERRGKDVEATRKACAKFAELPVSVMNFVEGTRFTPAKHARQQSPYKHLLRPKAGGVAFVLETMGTTLQAIIDVTIVYPGGRPTLADLLSGRVHEVRIDIQRRPLPTDLVSGSYENDPKHRVRFQQWMNGIWAEKDARIEAMLQPEASPSTGRPAH